MRGPGSLSVLTAEEAVGNLMALMAAREVGAEGPQGPEQVRLT